MSFFEFSTGLTIANIKFDALFGGLPHKSETELKIHEMILAASVQKVTEDLIICITRNMSRDTG